MAFCRAFRALRVGATYGTQMCEMRFCCSLLLPLLQRSHDAVDPSVSRAYSWALCHLVMCSNAMCIRGKRMEHICWHMLTWH